MDRACWDVVRDDDERRPRSVNLRVDHGELVLCVCGAVARGHLLGVPGVGGPVLVVPVSCRGPAVVGRAGELVCVRVDPAGGAGVHGGEPAAGVLCSGAGDAEQPGREL